ncbi:MAG: protein-methionine-sulfoxide reductase heme-binding subunit MsrQ [Pseudomonadota bacterium]
MTTNARIKYLGKPLVFALCLVPALLVVTDLFELSGRLGANPVEEILDRFGNWGLRFMMLALAVTPLRRITGLNWIARFRRMLGLFAFFYVATHFLVWLVLDQGLYLPGIGEDIVKRPFITLGMAALVLLLAMALTSTAGMRRRLGRRWDQLHTSAYAVGVLGVWHYWWQVKADILEPLIYALILSALLGYRLWFRLQRPVRQRSAIPAAQTGS